MPNEITGYPRPRPLDAAENKGAQRSAGSSPAASRASAPAAAPAPADSVSLTDAATRLQVLERLLAEVPAVDSARVAELRQAVADGSYAVDPARLADKLVALEKLLAAYQKE